MAVHRTPRRSRRQCASTRRIEYTLEEDRNIMFVALEQMEFTPNFGKMYRALNPNYSQESMRSRYWELVSVAGGVIRDRRRRNSRTALAPNEDVQEYLRDPELYMEETDDTLSGNEQRPKTPPPSSDIVSPSPLPVRSTRAVEETPTGPRQGRNRSRPAQRNRRAGKRAVSAHANRAQTQGQRAGGESSRSQPSASRNRPNQRSSRRRQEDQDKDEQSDDEEESDNEVPEETPPAWRHCRSDDIEVRVDVNRRHSTNR